MDRLTAMQVYAEVARSGSFTATADKLEMSRAMVTRHVGRIEAWLGARLLQRTTRKVTLTDAGEQALRHCLRMLELVQDVERDVAPADGVLRGQLRVTSSMSFAHAHLAHAVGSFLELHPQLKIDLNVGDAALDLVAARVDLAIRISNDPAPALIARPLATCDSVLVASPAYLAARGAPRRPADLARHQCLGYANFGRSTWRLHKDGDTREVSVVTRITANEATVLLEAALHGHGIALQPTYLASRHLAAKQLVAVLPQWRPEALAIQALYPSRRHLSPALRALLDFLVEWFGVVRW